MDPEVVDHDSLLSSVDVSWSRWSQVVLVSSGAKLLIGYGLAMHITWSDRNRGNTQVRRYRW